MKYKLFALIMFLPFFANSASLLDSKLINYSVVKDSRTIKLTGDAQKAFLNGAEVENKSYVSTSAVSSGRAFLDSQKTCAVKKGKQRWCWLEWGDLEKKKPAATAAVRPNAAVIAASDAALNGDNAAQVATAAVTAAKALSAGLKSEDYTPDVVAAIAAATAASNAASSDLSPDAVVKAAADTVVATAKAVVATALADTDEQAGSLTDLTTLPGLSSVNNMKLGLIRRNIQLGHDLKVPIYLLVGDVSGGSEASNNLLKLLDPDQGINLGLSYAVAYRVGRFCSQSKSFKGACGMGLDLGYRQVNLQVEGADDTNSQSAGYIALKNRWEFNVTDGLGAEAGWLSFNVKVAHFWGDDSNTLFDGVVDTSGLAVPLDDSYGTLSVGVELQLNDLVSITYDKFEFLNEQGLDNDSEEVFSVIFNLKEFDGF